MWTPDHRRAADRRGLRYPSDLTDDEWAIVAPMIAPARHGGRKRSVNVREVLNGIFYVLWTGCQWKACPRRSPKDRAKPPFFLSTPCGLRVDDRCRRTGLDVLPARALQRKAHDGCVPKCRPSSRARDKGAPCSSAAGLWAACRLRPLIFLQARLQECAFAARGEVGAGLVHGFAAICSGNFSIRPISAIRRDCVAQYLPPVPHDWCGFRYGSACEVAMLFHGPMVSTMILIPANALSIWRCTLSTSYFRNSCIFWSSDTNP